MIYLTLFLFFFRFFQPLILRFLFLHQEKGFLEMLPQAIFIHAFAMFPQDKVTAATKPKGAVEEEDRSASLKRSMTLEGAEMGGTIMISRHLPAWGYQKWRPQNQHPNGSMLLS